MRGANATAGISYFARALAHELGEGRERSRRDAVVDHQTGRIVGDRGDRREILDDVERTRLVLNAVDRLRERDDDADGGAVGRSAPEHAHADRARGAALIFDDNRLAQPFAQLLRDQPRGNVTRCTGRAGYDDADRARWKLLRVRGERQ